METDSKYSTRIIFDNDENTLIVGFQSGLIYIWNFDSSLMNYKNYQVL